MLFLVFFAFFDKKIVIHFLYRKNGPGRISGSSQTYLFNSNYNIDPSSMVIRHLKICVSFADKYICSLCILTYCKFKLFPTSVLRAGLWF